MDCYEAREALWPVDRPGITPDERRQARVHVESCADCESYLEQNPPMLDVYGRYRMVKAPEGLRARVLAALREAGFQSSSAAARRANLRVSTGGSRTRVGAFVSILAAAAIAAIWFGPSSRPEPDGSAFVQDFIRRAEAGQHISTSDHSEVSRFLSRELGVEIGPLQFAELELSGAEICLVDDIRGALILYKMDGQIVSHYVVPRDGAARRPPEVGNPADPPVGESAGTVVTWATSSVEQALVADRSAQELLEWARVSSSD